MKVATFNIRHGETAAGRVDLRQLGEVCAALGADVLALQEVDKWMRRTRWADISRRVGRRTGMVRAFGPALKRRWIGRYGNAVLVRGRLSDAELLPFPFGREPRAALLATAHVDGTTVSVACTHLSTDRRERDTQLGILLAVLAHWPLPRLLLGDLNGPPEDVGGLVEGAGMRLALAGPTFPASGPTKQIDHIAYAGFELLAAEVVATPMSDHHPVVAELRPISSAPPATGAAGESGSPPRGPGSATPPGPIG